MVIEWGSMKKRLNFGFAIKILRCEKNISQLRLAKLSGVTQPTIHYIEANKKVPSAQIISNLASALGVNEQRIYDLATIRKSLDADCTVSEFLKAHCDVDDIPE